MTGQVIHIRAGAAGSGVVEGITVDGITTGACMQVIFLAMCLGYDVTHPCPNNTYNLPAGTQLNAYRNLTFRNMRTQYASERFLNFFGVTGYEAISNIVLEHIFVEAFNNATPSALAPVQCVGTANVSSHDVLLASTPLPNVCRQ